MNTRFLLFSANPVAPFKDVGFLAYISSHYTTSAGATIRFDRTDRNDGGGYDPSKGTFSVPVAGLYNLYWHVLPYGGKSSAFDLMVNGKEKLRSNAYLGRAYPTPTGFINLRLAKGDKVHIQASDAGCKLHSGRFSTFGAELVRL